MKLINELLEINDVTMLECIVPPEHSNDNGSKAAYRMGHAHGQKKSKMVDAGKVFGVNAGAYKAGHNDGSKENKKSLDHMFNANNEMSFLNRKVREDKGEIDDYDASHRNASKAQHGWFVVDKRTKLDIHAGPFSDRQDARDEADDYDGAVVQYGHALPNGDFEKLQAPIDEANGIYEPITDSDINKDNGPLERRGGKLHKNKNGTVRVVTDGDKTLKQSSRKIKESEEEDKDDEDDEEQDQNTFYVAFYESDSRHAWIGKVSKEGGGKWHESSFNGKPDNRWGSERYMSYLSPEDIMGWIKKDFGRRIEIEGPFFEASEAKEYVNQNYGNIKESTMSESLSLVKTHKGEDGRCAKVYKDNEWNEYRVRFYDKDGKHKEAADYHADDLDDANDTAKNEIEKTSKTNEGVFTNYADWKQAVLLSHPIQAKSIKFRGKMEGEKTTVSAIIPGENKVFGIWDDAITSGTVLSEGKIDKALEYLKELIERGIEYPDAEHRAAKKFNVPHDKLRTAYDDEE